MIATFTMFNGSRYSLNLGQGVDRHEAIDAVEEVLFTGQGDADHYWLEDHGTGNRVLIMRAALVSVELEDVGDLGDGQDTTAWRTKPKDL